MDRKDNPYQPLATILILLNPLSPLSIATYYPVNRDTTSSHNYTLHILLVIGLPTESKVITRAG